VGARARRRRVSSLLLGLALCLLVPSGAVGSGGSASGTYTAYVACGVSASAKPAHKCERGEKVGAFFKSATDVQFTICAVFPNRQRLCASAQNAPAGVLKINKVTTSKLGRHKIVWYLPDRKIVRYFRLVKG
jgi:hypothetical protein